MIYLDNAATTLHKPQSVYRAVRDAMQTAAGYARGGYAAAQTAGEIVYEARTAVAELFGLQDPTKVVFTMNATHALNLAIHALCQEGTAVAVSGYEHNAVMRPLTARGIAPRLLTAPLWQPQAFLEQVEQALADGVRLFILNHVSNVFGYALPLSQTAALLSQSGAKLILDASQSAGVLPIATAALPCMAAVCMAGHKALYGPQGTGVLLALDEELSHRPLLTGGTGSVSAAYTQPDFLPDALESGTPNVPGIAGLAAGVGFVRSVGEELLLRHETRLITELVRALESVDRLRVFTGAQQTGVLSLQVEETPSETVAAALAEQEIAVRAGLQCAPLAHRTAGTEVLGTVRISVGFFNTMLQMEQTAQNLTEVVKNL